MAIAAFLVVRETNSGGGLVLAESELESREPFWYRALEEADAANPRLDSTVAGFRIGPNVGEVDGCVAVGKAGAELTPLTLSEGGRLSPGIALPPSYLPEKANLLEGPLTGAVACGGSVGFAQAYYDFPQSRSSKYGGTLLISRWLGEQRVEIDVAADRAGPTIFDGRMGVLIQPLTEDGFGDGYLIIGDGAGVTVIQSHGLPTTELVRIAESLSGG